MSEYFGKEVFKLGFGLMRLPKNADGSISVEETSRMVDRFMEAGGTYFDTAYVYDNGESEKVTKLALVERHPRESFTLCTKLNAGIPGITEEEAKKQFQISLERTGAGYFDYYLLHSLHRNNYKNYEDFHLWDFVKELKAKGLVKYYGFSFHGDPVLLDELLTAHPDVDFIQLQINYADWENPGVESRACYEVARKHKVSITVMEPVKGGMLANPNQTVRDIFTQANPDVSIASWAVRYAASLDGIITVLSGMSNMEQMEDNLSFMKNFVPLTDSEREVIDRVREALNGDNTIQCTNCRYCTKGCPMNIPIPAVFAVKNDEINNPSWDGGKQRYAIATQDKGKASECIECGQCEEVCPQHLPIIKTLKECVSMEW